MGSEYLATENTKITKVEREFGVRNSERGMGRDLGGDAAPPYGQRKFDAALRRGEMFGLNGVSPYLAP
jgi:hypothetical protein